MTTIIILFDSEHLTAVNTRKRIMVQETEMVAAEVQIITNILNSPLHRHAKSPLLWSHRRWLLLNFKIVKPTILEEMTVILTASNCHPKNYYVRKNL